MFTEATARMKVPAANAAVARGERPLGSSIFWNVSDIDHQAASALRHDVFRGVSFTERGFASDPMKSASVGWLAGNLERRTERTPVLDQQNQGPQCTACGSPMKLTAIEPNASGQDLRTFTCPECRRVQRHIIESTVTEAWPAPKK